MHRRMSTKTLALWLLLVGTVTQGCCQHWSYGLSPGGKRELDSLSDTLGNIVDGFPHVDTPCSVLGCAEESPLAKIYRMKGFLGSVTDRENGHRTYKKMTIL
ncbi:progonadoliberin-1-like isoform X2 [Siniperca chuatsi]|uniref:progonadoliberin-1-like isoform X2 n=1 Tax=Siniperca chuatsi TaxID=119488 RepID=UPI001CE0C734|nr:progonadoliberin-1-like isoform X2 [Siniperca chuatsi]